MTKDSPTPQPLTPKMLRPIFDTSKFDFTSTADLPAPSGPLGQDRAIDAIELAASTGFRDFNVFVQGTPGSGRHTIVCDLLARHASSRLVPDDWVYVNNFQMPDKPRALRLPPGIGMRLKKAMQDLVDDLANDIPALFEGDEYQSRLQAILQTYSDKQEAALNALNKRAADLGTAILRTPMGFTVAAMKDGDVIPPPEFEKLSKDEQETIKSNVEQVQRDLEGVMKEMPKYERARRREVRELNAEVVERGVEDSITEIMTAFAGAPVIEAYIGEVRADLIENADLFLAQVKENEDGNFPVATTRHYEKPQFQRYAVNVMVSCEPDGDGGPVIFEDFPTFSHLIGRVEHVQHMGTLQTNFTMIKPGALHRANGGYLVLDARQVLSQPFAWETLKRCLLSQAISIFSPGERFSLMQTTSLEPDPIPLDVRLVLVGERMLFHLLMAVDPDFPALFKIHADMNDEIALTDEITGAYAGLIGSIARRNRIKPLNASAVARVFEESIRLSGDTERLTLDIDRMSDILKEADHISSGGAEIRAADIDAAIEAATTRDGRIRDLMQDQITRGTVKIDTEGGRAGQINALSVLQIGGFRFGRPSRLTARVRMGSGKIVDIEREVELGGPLHSKGVMILSGYLNTHYALDAPMSLWASIVFEQNYGGIDGDSASAAELFVLLSALAEAPIDQSLAVTGSVNQLGEVQAIGGVNEKIEGFFDICATRGLTGQQGVLIPASNVRHLALRTRVVDAVAEGKFRVIPIETIDQGIELLTGCAAGARGSDGTFPEDSINGRAEARLHAFAENRRAFGARDGATAADGKEPSA